MIPARSDHMLHQTSSDVHGFRLKTKGCMRGESEMGSQSLALMRPGHEYIGPTYPIRSHLAGKMSRPAARCVDSVQSCVIGADTHW